MQEERTDNGCGAVPEDGAASLLVGGNTSVVLSRAGRGPWRRATEGYASAACVVCPVEVPASAFLRGDTTSRAS